MILTEIRTEAEYQFLKLWYSCEWMTLDKYPKSIFMIYNGEVLFEQDWETKHLWCHYSRVWLVFGLEPEIHYKFFQIRNSISDILKEHFKKRGLIPHIRCLYTRSYWKDIPKKQTHDIN